MLSFLGVSLSLGDRKNTQEVLIYVDSQALCGAACERLLHRLTYQIFIILRHIFWGTAEFYAVVWNGKRGDGLAANIPWFFILSLYQMAQVLPLVVKSKARVCEVSISAPTCKFEIAQKLTSKPLDK